MSQVLKRLKAKIDEQDESVGLAEGDKRVNVLMKKACDFVLGGQGTTMKNIVAKRIKICLRDGSTSSSKGGAVINQGEIESIAVLSVDKIDTTCAKKLLVKETGEIFT